MVSFYLMFFDQLTVTPAPPSGCTDSDPIQCPLWAANGECTKNPSWMRKNCQKSCEICGKHLIPPEIH